MFPNPNCYKLRNLSRQFQKTVADMMKDELKSISERLKPYVKEVSLDSHPSANGILDTVISAKVHGLKVPSDIDNKLLEDLERVVVNEWFYGSMISSEVRRLGMGRLMGVIRDRMVHRAEGTENEENGKLKLALYSGHDTTVAPLLIIMDTFDKR
ncbi:histidine phosphatase superfamily [Pilobolus umbonatus]|nr:histidine phosphatase superfamily [Pilobolus umbonatus]